MFSSTNSGISLPQLISPCFNLTAASAFGGLNEEETFLHYDRHDLFSHFFPEINSAANKTMISKPEVRRSNGDHSRTVLDKQSSSKRKDRHSKIVTAQGPRDRRVRLSMEIARKFFDLQDSLGFDKASETLDWLLTQSKAAIQEVVQMNHINCPSSKSLCSFLECGNPESTKKKRMLNPEKLYKETKALQMGGFGEVAKELRAKARARARERTKEKKSLKEMSTDQDKKLPHLNPSISSQLATTWSQIGSQKTICSVSIHTGTDGFLTVRSNMNNSTESSSNFSQWSPNTAENWDISSTMASSDLCTLANMDSSNVLQINRKPCDFEECSNNNRD